VLHCTLRLRKKRHVSIFATSFSDEIQFCYFLAETCLRVFETNIIYRDDHFSFHVHVLYLVNTSSDWYGIQHGTLVAPVLLPPNSPDLNSVDLSTARPHSTLLTWSGVWSLHGLVCSSMSLTRQSTSGVDGCAPVWELLDDSWNTRFDNRRTVFFTCDCRHYLIVCGNFIFDTVKIVAKFLQNTVRTHKTRCSELRICVWFKLSGVCFCPELANLDDNWVMKISQKGDGFSRDTVYN